MGSYPVVEVPFLSGGIVIAAIALVHVVLAHFAVGAGFLIDGFERADPRQEHPGIQRVLDLLARIFVYVNFVVGAITGVGIWFAISIYSPDATEHLIGEIGTAVTALRPSGKVQVGDRRYDAQTDRGFVDQGTEIKVVKQDGFHLVVTPVKQENA